MKKMMVGLICALASSACGGADCPAGTSEVEGHCFANPPDGSAQDASVVDAAPVDASSVDGSSDEPGDAGVEDACSPQTFYADVDGDGFGDPSSVESACEMPAGFVDDDTDCDDTDGEAHPEAEEVCDGVDQDCDGEVDEELPTQLWYIDCDGDGFAASAGGAVSRCAAPDEPPSGCPDGSWVARAPETMATIDCDDTDATRFPGAGWSTSTVGRDLDCSGMVERRDSLLITTGLACSWLTIGTVRSCQGPAGWVGGSVPACGAAGTYRTCVATGSNCGAQDEPRIQACR